MFHFDRSQNPIKVIDAPIMRGCDRLLNSIKRFFFMDGELLKDYGMIFIEPFKKSGSDHIYSIELFITHLDFFVKANEMCL